MNRPIFGLVLALGFPLNTIASDSVRLAICKSPLKPTSVYGVYSAPAGEPDDVAVIENTGDLEELPRSMGAKRVARPDGSVAFEFPGFWDIERLEAADCRFDGASMRESIPERMRLLSYFIFDGWEQTGQTLEQLIASGQAIRLWLNIICFRDEAEAAAPPPTGCMSVKFLDTIIPVEP